MFEESNILSTKQIVQSKEKLFGKFVFQKLKEISFGKNLL